MNWEPTALVQAAAQAEPAPAENTHAATAPIETPYAPMKAAPGESASPAEEAMCPQAPVPWLAPEGLQPPTLARAATSATEGPPPATMAGELGNTKQRSDPRRLEFTETNVLEFTCPPMMPFVRYWDTKCSGLGLRVWPSGRREYVVSGYIKNTHIQRSMGIGEPSQVFTLEDAKLCAAKRRKTMRKGKDPVKEEAKKKIKSEACTITLEKSLELFLASPLKAQEDDTEPRMRTARTIKDYEYTVRHYL